MALIAHNICDRETIRCIDHDVGRCDQTSGIGGRQALTDGFDPDLRIQVQQGSARSLCLEKPDVTHAIDRLTMQIRFFDTIMIDDHETPDAGCG
jgi:hypothetical protein